MGDATSCLSSPCGVEYPPDDPLDLPLTGAEIVNPFLQPGRFLIAAGKVVDGRTYQPVPRVDIIAFVEAGGGDGIEVPPIPGGPDRASILGRFHAVGGVFRTSPLLGPSGGQAIYLGIDAPGYMPMLLEASSIAETEGDLPIIYLLPDSTGTD